MRLCAWQVLTDGLPTALDWGRAGKELTPREWHGAVQADGEGRRPLMLDCRNLYESEVGSFEGAEPVGTLTFSETWDTLRSRPHMHMPMHMQTCNMQHATCMAYAWHVHVACAWHVHVACGMYCIACTSQ